MRYSSSPACVEARESTSDAALDRERIALHRSRCAECSEHAEREDAIARSLHLISERPLNDLARARIQSRLAGDFDRMAAENASGGHRSNRIWIAAAFAAAVLLWFVWPKEVFEPPAHERLIAYLVAGTSQARLAPADVIEAGPGMIVRAEIEGQGEVTLVGPGRVERSSSDRMVLESGLLLVHVRRPFVVSAGEVTVRVLGTRFAVDRRDPAGVRVSVSEGVVEVSHRGAVARVERGHAWPAGSLVEERLAIAELDPPRGPSGVVVISGTPAGAVAVLDGLTLGPTPLIARLTAGEHRLRVQADLHRNGDQVVAIPEGGVIDVSFALDREAPQVAPSRIPPRPRSVTRSVPAAPPPEEVETAEKLYRSAEALLSSGHIDEAQAALEDLVARYGSDPLVDSALYELARLAYEGGRLEESHGRLLRLLARSGDAAFAESGQRLLCQIDLETHRYDDANACWRSFRERYSASVHDAEALASLIALAQIWSDCPRVKALAEEFVGRYPGHAMRSDVEARVERCAR